MPCFTRASIVAISTVLLTQLASAADLPRKAPPAPFPPPPSWTGFYVGANIGGGWGNRDVGYTPNDPLSAGIFPTGFPLTSFDMSGVVGGLQLGYNWQFNRNWLVGFETDFDWSDVRGSGSSPLSNPNLANGAPPLAINADEHIKWFGTVRARLGYLPTDNLLVYATGGFAYGKVEHTANIFNGSSFIFGGTAPPFALNCLTGVCYAGSSNHTSTGWTVGGGIEYAFWQKWTVKADYLYIRLDDSSVTMLATSVPIGAATPSINANFGRTNINVARIGVNYRF